MRTLLDTDVVLDVILAREPFAKDAAELLDLGEQGLFEPYISAITPLNIFYIARKAKAVRDLRQAIQRLLETVGVCPIDKSILRSVEAIVTRDIHDYKYATLPIFTPEGFLQHLRSQQDQL